MKHNAIEREARSRSHSEDGPEAIVGFPGLGSSRCWKVLVPDLDLERISLTARSGCCCDVGRGPFPGDRAECGGLCQHQRTCPAAAIAVQVSYQDDTGRHRRG